MFYRKCLFFSVAQRWENANRKAAFYQNFAGLRLGFSLLGERTSTLTMSNMGRIHVPEALRPHIDRVDAFLTPWICSGYNCVLMTLDGKLILSFTRRNRTPILERCLVRRLRELGLEPGWSPEAQRVHC